MIRKAFTNFRSIAIWFMTLILCLSAMAALVGGFYPLGLTLVQDGVSETYVGLRAESGATGLFIQFVTDLPQDSEKNTVLMIGESLTSNPTGVACFVNRIEPVTWDTSHVENRSGFPFSQSFETADFPSKIVHGMRHTIMVSIHCIPLIACATLVAFFVCRGPWRRWNRRRLGLCLHCGYNLTGNVSGKCSECGKAI